MGEARTKFDEEEEEREFEEKGECKGEEEIEFGEFDEEDRTGVVAKDDDEEEGDGDREGG